MSIDVENKFKVYEIDGEDTQIGQENAKMGVVSHWNNDRLVRLVIGGKTYTVSAQDLKKATDNAVNTNRHG